jgi:hypothetical protein
MPVYHRPRQAIITEDGGGGQGLILLLALGGMVLVVASLAMFILAHLALLAVCAAVFVGVIGGLAVVFRQAASPRRWREYRYPRPTVRLTEAEAARVISAPQLRAIEAPRAVTDQSPHVNRDAVPRVP